MAARAPGMRGAAGPDAPPCGRDRRPPQQCRHPLAVRSREKRRFGEGRSRGRRRRPRRRLTGPGRVDARGGWGGWVEVCLGNGGEGVYAGARHPASRGAPRLGPVGAARRGAVRGPAPGPRYPRGSRCTPPFLHTLSLSLTLSLTHSHSLTHAACRRCSTAPRPSSPPCRNGSERHALPPPPPHPTPANPSPYLPSLRESTRNDGAVARARARAARDGQSSPLPP